MAKLCKKGLEKKGKELKYKCKKCNRLAGKEKQLCKAQKLKDDKD